MVACYGADERVYPYLCLHFACALSLDVAHPLYYVCEGYGTSGDGICYHMSMNTQPSDEQVINITGTLVALGPMRRDLIPLYQAWVNDFGMQRTLGDTPSPRTVEAVTAHYERFATATDGAQFTICERETMRPIGITELQDIDHRHRTAEFVIFIGEADARGKGYGTEATRLMLDYAFTALGLYNVMLSVFSSNLAGIRSYEKAGFREIGRRRKAHRMGGKMWDRVYMDCLTDEFESPVLARVLIPDERRPNTK